MEKASHHFFFARLSMKGIQWFCFGEDGGLKIQDVFFTKVSRSSSIIEFGFGFCLLLYFFASTFQTIQFQYVFWVRKISMVFFSISCSRSCFFLTRQVFTTRMLVVRTRCGWIVTASLGHPFGAVKITRFPVKKTKRIASQIISKDLCLCLYGLMPFCTSASLQGGIEREVVQEHSPWLSKAIGSMGLVYLLTFTIKINHSWCG